MIEDAADLAGRLVIELADPLGPSSSLEVKIRLETIELWLAERAVAIVDRDLLAGWLDDPRGTFERHEVSLWVSALGPVVEVHNRVRPTLLRYDTFGQLRQRLLRPPSRP